MTQRLLASLALVAVMFAALAPALANAFGINNMGPAAWIELCSGQGTKRIAVDSAGEPIVSGDASGSTQTAAHLAEHCPFCHVEHAQVGLRPALSTTVPRSLAHQAFPTLVYVAARPSHAWAPALARAPPTAS